MYVVCVYMLVCSVYRAHNVCVKCVHLSMCVCMFVCIMYVFVWWICIFVCISMLVCMCVVCHDRPLLDRELAGQITAVEDKLLDDIRDATRHGLYFYCSLLITAMHTFKNNREEDR